MLNMQRFFFEGSKQPEVTFSKRLFPVCITSKDIRSIFHNALVKAQFDGNKLIDQMISQI